MSHDDYPLRARIEGLLMGVPTPCTEGGAQRWTQDAVTALREALNCISEGIDRACEWTSYYPDEEPAAEAGSLTSGCGQEWISDTDGDPPGRWMKFCPFCGAKTPFSEVPKK